MEWSAKYHTPNYGRTPLVLVRGDGARVWDSDGKEYLDFTAGIAVTSLGHCHPVVTGAIREAAATLLHVSNIFHNRAAGPPGQAAHRALLRRPGVLLQLGRGGQRGRAQARRASTPRSTAGHRPLRGHRHRQLVPRAHAGHRQRHRPAEVPARLRAADARLQARALQRPARRWSARWTARPRPSWSSRSRARAASYVPDDGYLPGLRKLCDESGALLVFDEVQTGVGRTGKLWGYEHWGVEPDVMTLAKALANGIPIGAMLCREDVASALTAGHATARPSAATAVRDLGGAGHADDDDRATGSPSAPPSAGRELTDALRALQAKHAGHHGRCAARAA